MRKTNLAVILPLLLFSTGCNPLDALYGEIKAAGYIPYQNVMAHSATGALIGGTPSRLQLVAPPETCFPSTVNGVPTQLRYRDESQLPSQARYASVGFDANVQVLKGLSAANGTLNAGAQFSHVDKMEMSFEGVHIEYLDSVRVADFYRKNVPELCKEFLDKYAVIFQALQTDKMAFKFYSKDGGSIKLSTENIKEIVNVSADLSWEITNDVELVITTPKYLGYQLGRLQRRDNGIAIWRATRTCRDRFVFEWIHFFEDMKAAAFDGPSVPPFDVKITDFKEE
jgi:hypothetical protein